uniref:F5/8 type C domain-containing protein n=2 Tax=Magallana gigas TaxID=29159 RepID=A0A8W8LRE1_MAGGI|eukprot:XP_019918558.1 PREDICTED: uncharacterized protein LOC105317741 [Crassostrea gigas]
MVGIKTNFLLICLLVNNMAQQWYRMRTTYPDFLAICTEQKVASFLSCAALGRETNDATFFFEADKNHCRWNCTFIFRTGVSDGNIEWRKYEIESTKNSAPKKTITSSSVYGNAYHDWSPKYATDSIFQSGGIKIFHSANETSPWIMVDLKDVTTVIYLRIYVRMDGLGERFHDVAVEVANSSSYIQRGFYKGPAMTQEVVEILCDDPTNARYVRLRIIHGSRNVLNIAELEIYTK